MAMTKQGTTGTRKTMQPAGGARDACAPNAEWAKFLKANRTGFESDLAENYPAADAGKTIGEALREVAEALPHYKYSGEEGAGFLRYVRMLLSVHVPAGAGRPRRPASPSADSDEEVLQAWREQYAMFRDVGLMALEELERSTANRLHWQVFQRIRLQREKPKDVAAALGKSMAMVYQTKKRMGDRCRAIVEKLFASLQSQLEADARALSGGGRAKGRSRTAPKT